MPEKATMWFRVGGLGHIVSVDLQTEINHVDNQSINPAYVRAPQYERTLNVKV